MYKSFLRCFALILIGLTVAYGTSASVFAQGGRRGGGAPQPSLSQEEQKLGQAINAASDPMVKLQTAATLLEKYPQSRLRPRVAEAMSTGINRTGNAATRTSLGQEYLKIFTEPAEQDLVLPSLIEGFIETDKIADAFSAAATFLAHQPNSLRVLERMVEVGTDQAKQRNSTFAAISIQYGTTAAQLIESDVKPADLDDALWRKYKAGLPSLYQSLGILHVVANDIAGAKASLGKASELAPADPFNYLLLGGILNNEYEAEAKRYQNMPDGQAKRDAAPKVMAMLDGVIDAYAHVVALSDGVQALEPVRKQFLDDLEAYYKARHENSTDGLQALIAKYKATK